MPDTHPLKTVAGLQKLGFKGFLSVKDLRLRPRPPDVPTENGIYLVIRERSEYPEFLARGTGGLFKGKDPNVGLYRLKPRWVDGALIIYVGRSNDLRRRVGELINFGQRKRVGHRGGRLMWQIADAEDFKICWKQMPNEHQAESRMLGDFAQAHNGMQPFANLIET